MFQIATLFPALALIGSVIAYVEPSLFTPYRGAIVPLLMVIMFAMGLTLTLADFARVAKRPLTIGLGVLLQYTVMPLSALAIGTVLALPAEILVGLVLLGSCPGGTASNVISYLARANVALSVTMTLISSLLAVVATPTITWLLVGQTVPIAVGAMIISLVQIVLVPVLVGVALNTLLSRHVDRIKPALPWVAMTAIVLAIAIVVALNRDGLAMAGPIILVAIFLHNAAGWLGGYWVPRALGYDRTTCRTIAIEVAIQNSGLATALALQHFSALTALPGALASVWQNLSGAALAGWWAKSADPAEARNSIPNGDSDSLS
ncbi:MAG: bile acid:sodium symporter family protein [Pseudomonadota bacterium]